MLNLLKNTRTTYFFASAILIFLLFHLFQHLHQHSHSTQSEYENLSYSFDYQSIILINGSNYATNLIHKKNYVDNSSIDSTLEAHKLTGFVYDHDSIVYWNNSIINPENFFNLKTDNNVHCVKLPSGWYLYIGNIVDSYTIYIFDLIKSDYQMDNPLLIPGFMSEYSSSENILLSLDEENSLYQIYNSAGNFLIGINFDHNNNESKHGNLLVFTLFILAIISIIIAIYNWIDRLKKIQSNQDLKLFIFILFIIGIWTTLYFTGYPYVLKHTSIFNEYNYNLPLTNSTGELIINSIFLSIISIFTYLIIGKNGNTQSPITIIIKYTLLWMYLLLIFSFIYNTIQNPNLTYITELTFNDISIILSIFIIILLNVSIYYTLLAYLNPPKTNKIPYFVPILIVVSGIFFLYLLIDVQVTILAITICISIVIITIKYFIWRRIADIFLKNLLLLLILSVTSAILINYSLTQKKNEYQKYVAITLATTNDIKFEKEFSANITQLKNDNILNYIVLNDTVGNQVENYIRSNYFSGYFNKYDLQITNCSDDELIEIQPEGTIYNCSDYFYSLIDDFTISSVDSTLYQFNSETEGYYYICFLKIHDKKDKNNDRNLFIEFVSSHVPEGLGYPELLVDSKSQTLNLSNFSFARYSGNLLTYKFGEYQYNTYLSTQDELQYNTFSKYSNSIHYTIKINDESYLIVSRKETSITMKIVIFSLTFILLSIISVIVYFIAYARRAISLFRLNFKTRLQTFVIATLTITFILIAISTLFYIEESTKEEMEKQLSEKTNSVLIELQHKLSAVSDLRNEDKEFLHQLLRKFSLVFFSDINLYDKSGQLIATSRPEIFDKNLLSTYINPDAYKAIFIENELNYITEEKIGSLRYYSSYVPINLNNYFPIGIVNLPYFARQSEYTKSYYIMLSYLINIYVIIGIIGTLIAVTFSRYLTRPLVLLQESISNIRIDQQNEKIEWNKNDEIGLLINEYNRMVDKLEESAGLLVRSERESAWREVAKQIAHEIKNPLTPMKLNVQYLEKAYRNNDPDFKSKIDSISKSLITQIDTLDNVAETFSNFAKNKRLDYDDVNLRKVITTAVDLFNKKSNVSIKVNYENQNDVLNILGFEKDTLRAINNILKNAIQSVENKDVGIININVSNNDNFVEVSISDNGKGIASDMKAKIFQPYFTTKTSGTGLGLAIVKNIIIETGGDVHFESTVGIGTTFFLKFPRVTK